MCVSVGWHANHARKNYNTASSDQDFLNTLTKTTKSSRKVDPTLVPGLLAQLAATVSDENQRRGLANLLASMPRDEREQTLKKVKAMSPSELKERAELHDMVKLITTGLSDEANVAFFKLLVSLLAQCHCASIDVLIHLRCNLLTQLGCYLYDWLCRIAELKWAVANGNTRATR